MLEIFNDIEQGTDEWRELRAGTVTASEFSQLLAKGKGKTRRTLLLKKAGERITGNPSESFTNQHMERGTEQEEIARSLYEQRIGVDIINCGFMKNNTVGYSPDGLVGEDGLIEIKSRLAHIQADSILKGKIPSENIAQIQGGLWVSGRRYLDYISYCPGMPLFIKRVLPDHEYHDDLSEEVKRFEVELCGVVDQLVDKF